MRWQLFMWVLPRIPLGILDSLFEARHEPKELDRPHLRSDNVSSCPSGSSGVSSGATGFVPQSRAVNHLYMCQGPVFRSDFTILFSACLSCQAFFLGCMSTADRRSRTERRILMATTLKMTAAEVVGHPLAAS
ncbi:hypothetical protein AcW1_001937 [Taiwanofungus camphoratus]|nr:hypothetical protein AcV5_000006 [Antrodia cinnamomea]KAI0945175.1 hypothetical protein AcV7_001786 [Antrodia cinnamomea]KAI0945797.1 hypothetical protein AcW1_001937 [Antrodia cinnamomea]